jgi:hypothetical protein
MSAVCRFCGQQFANAQGVRAHLKSCAAYQARRGNASPPKASLRDHRQGYDSLGNEEGLDPAPASGRVPEEGPFDPVQHLGQRLAAERIGLQLREVEEARDELDRRKEAKEHERQQQADQKAAAERTAARDRENAQRLAAENQRARERRDAAERQRQTQRREIIQSVKDAVVNRWFAPIQNRSDLQARSLDAIERKLSHLAVEELPRSELMLIAEAVRDAVYRPAVEAVQHAQKLAARRPSLIEHGCSYAGRELRRAEGLKISEVWEIERRVREELAEVEGDETMAEIENWVDDILENEGIGWDEDDD